jgi:hypothetical protein
LQHVTIAENDLISILNSLSNKSENDIIIGFIFANINLFSNQVLKPEFPL